MDSELITVNTEDVHVDLTIHRRKQVELVVTVVAGGGATEENAILHLDPQTIQISGSDIALEQVGDVINLGTINLADYETASIIYFTIPTYEGVTNDSGETEVVVELRFEGVMTKEFAIENFTIIGVPEDFEATVVTERLPVKIRGPYSLMNKLTAEDIIATVDFTNVEPGYTTLRVNITFGPQFEALGVLGKPSVTASLREATLEE